jgi:hypothetical protein
VVRIGLIILLLAVVFYFVVRESKPTIDTFMATDVSQLLAKPGEFDGRFVTVKGTVQESAAVMGVGGYRLSQGPSEIYILSSHGIPPTGAQVTVSGTFKQALALGGLQYAVIVERK